MEVETKQTARSTPSRHEKSLGLLTMKFLSLVQEAEDGVLDLKVAADSLAVKQKQKRRIYDITNVLEGVGLIQKKNKNVIQWRGENRGSQSQEVLEQVNTLKAQISQLEAQEKELDEQKARLEENIEHLKQDPITSTYNFVTHEDVCSAFSGDTLLAVVAPAGTQLEVHRPQMGQCGQKRYQMNLRSHSAPIQVMLLNMDSDSRVPVVFPVPPANDICLLVPTPPNTPASLQRFPYSTSTCSTSNTSSSDCSQESLSSHHQMVLPEHTPVPMHSSTSPDVQMECHSQSSAVLEQQMDLTDQEFQAMLDVSSLLKLSAAGDHVKDNREGVIDFIDELMSTDGVDYSFNLDDNEGVCDLFDVQILNY